jgi:hypothetical protein
MHVSFDSFVLYLVEELLFMDIRREELMLVLAYLLKLLKIAQRLLSQGFYLLPPTCVLWSVDLLNSFTV